MNRVFFGGVPTAADVKKLKEALSADLKVDQVIPHEQIEAVIALKRTTSRYRTVVSAWRRQLLDEQNVDLDSIAGVGYLVLTEPERVRVSIRDHRRGTRKVSRSVGRMARVRTETLPDAERVQAEHASRLMQGSLVALRSATKEIAVRFSSSQDANPRLKGGR